MIVSSRPLTSLIILTTTMFLISACGKTPAPEALVLDTRVDSIVGGRPVTSKDEIAKYIVGLSLLDNKQNPVGTCTGSLIASDLVLTAAHCIPAEGEGSLQIEFGLDLRNDSPVQQPTRTRSFRKVSNFRSHEAYGLHRTSSLDTFNDAGHDIALVHFTGGLPKGYSPARFLNRSEFLSEGSPVVLAGYGVENGFTGEGSRLLRVVQVNILDTDRNPFEVELEQRQGSGACYGDSGGPAFVKINNRHYLFGVTSRGEHGCVTTSIYTNALAYRNWILKAASLLREQHRQESRKTSEAELQ